nr:hypothetical protein [uncultured Carboxylicivirga sp.]
MKNALFILLELVVFFTTSCSDELVKDYTKPLSHEENENRLEELVAVNSQSQFKVTSGEKSFPYYNDIDILTPPILKFIYEGQEYHILNFTNQSTSGYVDNVTRFDVKKEDGWEVIFNFIPHDRTDVQLILPIVVLYNRYRGQFKLMYYHLGNDTAHGGPVFASLAIEDNSIKKTPLFNCTSKIIDPLERKLGAVVSMCTDLSDMNQKDGLVRKNWYAFEWNVAYYDSSIKDGADFKFQVWGSDSLEINMEGVINGNISGNIQTGITPGTDNSVIDSGTIKDALTKTSTSAFMKWKGNDLVDYFAKKEKKSSGLLKKIYGLFNSDIISDGASSILGPAANFFSKPISKLIGKFFPGKSPEPTNYTVNLQTNLTSKFEGKIKQDIAIAPIRLGITGGLQLGVFRLNRNPSVEVSEAFFKYNTILSEGLDSYRYCQLCKLKDNVDDIVQINPELLKVATIEKEFTIVCIDYNENIFMKSYENKQNEFGIVFEGNKDVIVKEINDFSGSIIFNIVPKRYATDREWSTPKRDKSLVVSDPINIYVRLNLIVRPKNGDMPVSHTYYIKPSYIENQQYTPYPKKMGGNFPPSI